VSSVEPAEAVSAESRLPAEEASAQTAQPAQPGDVRPERATRRRLSPEQQREMARLYAEGTTPTAEIRTRFGIGESSLYRIVQREGVPLRGRAAATPEPAPAADAGS
jgi:hypothetical protein